MLTIYVFSNGDIATKVLNAVVAVLGENFKTAMWMSCVLALLLSAIRFVQTKNVKLFGTLFLTFVLVNNVLLLPKVTVQVYDTTNPMASNTIVDHVPYGLAFPAAMITTVMYALTMETENVFHMPDDLEYNRTGMLFGSRLLQATLRTTQFDNTAKEDFNNFFENCMIPDIAIGKYSWNDIASSPNLFDTLNQFKMSPLRGIYINQSFSTCEQAYPLLKKELTDTYPKQLEAIGIELFGSQASQPQYKGILPSMIETTYSTLLNGQTSSAQDIVLQNTALNYFRNALGTLGAKLDAPAAMQLNYAYTEAMQKQNEGNLVSYRMATYTLPMLQTSLLLILLGCFPFIVLLLFIPQFTVPTIKYYLYGLLYLASWPLLFAIANFVFTASLSMKLGGYQSIDFSNLNQVSEMNLNFVSTASWVITMIPMFPLFLKGGAFTLSQLAQNFGSTQHHTAAASGTEVATGNVSLGNMGLGNKSWFNTSANKYDTNVSHASGASMIQGSDGVLTTTFADGSQAINANPAISSGAFNLNFANTDSTTLQNNFTKSINSARTESQSAESLIQNAFNKGTHLNSGQGTSEAFHFSASQDESTHVSTAYQDLMGAAKDYNRTHNIDDSQIGNTVSSLVIGANIGAEGKLGTPSIEGSSVGLNIGVSGRGQAEAISSHTTSARDDMGIRLSDDQAQRISHDVQVLTNYGSRISADNTTHQDLSLVDQQAYSLYQSKQHAERASAEYQQAMGYQNQLSQIHSDSQSYNENRTQAFIEWGNNLTGEDSYKFKGILSQAMKGEITPNSSAYLQSYIDRFEQSNQISTISSSSLNNATSKIHQDAMKNEQLIDNSSSLSSSYQRNVDNFKRQQEPKVEMNSGQFNSMKNNVNSKIESDKAAILKGQNEIVTQTTGLQNNINNQKKDLNDRANNSATGLAIDSFSKSTDQEKQDAKIKYDEFSNPLNGKKSFNNLDKRE